MADGTINQFVGTGTTAERTAFVPDPPSPVNPPGNGYTFWDTDLQALYAWDVGLADWVQVGGSGSGAFVQQVNTQTGAMATGTATIPADNTIPQNTEGTEFMTLAITPTSAANVLQIQVTAILSTGTAVRTITAALFQDTTANAIAVATAAGSNTGYMHTVTFTHTMTAGTTSATTFKVRAGVETSGTVTFNGSGGAAFFGGVLASSITITEYVP